MDPDLGFFSLPGNFHHPGRSDDRGFFEGRQLGRGRPVGNVEEKGRFSRRPVNAQGQLHQVPQPFSRQLVLLGEDFEGKTGQVRSQVADELLERPAGRGRRDRFREQVPEVKPFASAEFHQAGQLFFEADFGQAPQEVSFFPGQEFPVRGAEGPGAKAGCQVGVHHGQAHPAVPLEQVNPVGPEPVHMLLDVRRRHGAANGHISLSAFLSVGPLAGKTVFPPL